MIAVISILYNNTISILCIALVEQESSNFTLKNIE